MTKLYEFQGKKLLENYKIPVPESGIAHSIEEAKAAAKQIGKPVVLKAQVWVTGRAKQGLIRYAKDAEEAGERAKTILGQVVKNTPIDTLLIEEKLDVENEFFAGLIIDDVQQAPVMVFSSRGGTGIEEISRQFPQYIAQHVVDLQTGFHDYAARDLVRKTGIHGKLQMELGNLLVKLYEVARHFHARSAEINPIILTKQGQLFAGDCRIAIDDNAVYKFPELEIEVAREYDHPATRLEKISWNVEKKDYRGTFYFIQMAQRFEKGDGYIGFHGAGGGGSMMSMDALLNLGFKLANFVDTSGNPPASKVYRAARIILSQKNIDGYFLSGSGVASQEQFHSARGLVKAFLEHPLAVPAVIRLGGNAEDQANRILQQAQGLFSVPLEAYGKDDPPDFCAKRLKSLVDGFKLTSIPKRGLEPLNPRQPYQFLTVTQGTVQFDHAVCLDCASKICIHTCSAKILSMQEELPVLNITTEEAAKGRCVECLACEIECLFEGNGGCRILLPIPGLEEVG